VDDGRVLIETADVTGALHTLTAWALGRDIALGQLTVTRRSLEDVYLELVSR
jgi:ABC-2 type transport system ATP-binding protein